jgi:hypothetical protein
MHPYAWRQNDIEDLVSFAKRYHVELIPEIESLGHSRMFTRLPDARDYLHQTEMMKSEGWFIIDIPGYINVLCPASDKALQYLGKMYERTAQLFPGKQLHVGCDEVTMTKCARCENKFGKISKEDWFLKHLLHCKNLAAENSRTIALWSDMLIKYPKILDGLSKDNIVIYDWHYFPDFSAESVDLFQEKGFQIIACPALVHWPHIIFPDHNNYTNISRFTKIARDRNLMGVNTTIWAPVRYMSDILWTGIAFAAAQSWGGSNWNETDFYRDFVRVFFGSPKGAEFMTVWKELCAISIHLDTFMAGCWADEEGLQKGKTLAAQKAEEINKNINRLKKIQKELSEIGKSIEKHQIEWRVIEQTTAIRCYVLEHLVASNNVQTEHGWNLDLVTALDESCLLALKWIENNWDRNRYADDPNKDGMYMPNQNILHKFREMHAFHQKILGNLPYSKEKNM